MRRIAVSLGLLFLLHDASVAQAWLQIGRTFDLRFEDDSLWSLLEISSLVFATSLLLARPRRLEGTGSV